MATIPRYERLTQLLKDKLRAGDFKTGERFFSQNELMSHYKLSFSTVTRALNELERAGYLSREQGRGTFVRSIPDKEGRTELRSADVAVFLPWDVRNLEHVNLKRLYQSMEAARSDLITLRIVPYGRNVSELEPFLFSRQPTHAAIFVYPEQSHVAFIEGLSETLPVVVIGNGIDGPKVSSVRAENVEGAEKTVQYLLNQGHTSIGCLCGSMETITSGERLDGYRKALKSANIEYRESLVARTDPVEMNGYGATLDMFDRNSDVNITAIFAAGDLLAMGAMAAARSMGKRIPEDLSVVGFDDIEGAKTLQPPLTTFHIPIEEMGLTAVSLVAELLKNEKHSHVVLHGHLVERATVAAQLSNTLTLSPDVEK